MNLTYDQAIQIYNSVRKHNFAKPTTGEFRNGIINHLFPDSEDVLDESNLNILSSKILTVYRRLNRYFKAKQKKPKCDDTLNKNEICLSLENYPTPPKTRRSKPLQDITSYKQKYPRLQPLIDMIKDVALEEQTPEHYLIGVILHQLYYKKDKRIADIGNSLMDLNKVSNISVEIASNLKSYNNLGREGYQREIRALQSSGFDILPSWKKVRNFEQSITPQTQQLPDGLGIEFNYKDAIELTLTRILELLDIQQIPEEDLLLEVKDGLDGSGSHSIFNQNG